MIQPIGRGSQNRGTLLLADISGYTGFLTGVGEAHRALIIEAEEPPPAYAALSGLLDAILAAIKPTFRLAKFEGDAIFAVEDGPLPHGPAILDRVKACYEAFREQLGIARAQWTCTCSGCIRIGDLDLKFVLHHGDYVVHRIANQEELAGLDVIVAHRLLRTMPGTWSAIDPTLCSRTPRSRRSRSRPRGCWPAWRPTTTCRP